MVFSKELLPHTLVTRIQRHQGIRSKGFIEFATEGDDWIDTCRSVQSGFTKKALKNLPNGLAQFIRYVTALLKG